MYGQIGIGLNTQEQSREICPAIRMRVMCSCGMIGLS